MVILIHVYLYGANIYNQGWTYEYEKKKSTLNIHSGDIKDGGGIENLQGKIINFYLIKLPGSTTYTCNV